MADGEGKRSKGERPHAVLIPLPALGHITPLLQLAQVLIDRGVFVTFLNTEVNHKLLNPVSTSQIRFLSFPDGLPPEHPRLHKVDEFWDSVINVCPPHIHAIMQHSNSIANNLPHDYDAATPPPVTAIVFDACIFSAKAIARQYGVAAIMFVCHAACSLSAFLSINSLIQHGIMPIRGDEERQRELMEKDITFLPGLEWLRVKDLPSLLHVTDISDAILALLRRGYGDGKGVDAVVINTWQELQVEGTVLAQLNAADTYAGKLLPVGPLIEWTGGRTPVSRSLWTEDERCIPWLNNQKARSVVYVSFGSITLMRPAQAAELAWGLIDSGCSFLWVLRPDFFIHREHEQEQEHGLEAVLSVLKLADKTQGAGAGPGMVVEWAPQWAVLRHGAVGGFVSHCGWNSCVESVTAGVPMLCWPYFADQLTNCRMLTHACKAGLEMGHDIKRHEVATSVRALMDDDDKAGIRRNAESIRQSGLWAVSQGGSSSTNLCRLLELISS